MLRIILTETHIEGNMLDIENVDPRPRLPAVRCEQRVMLKVNTPQFTPSILPMFRQHGNVNNRTNTQAIEACHVAQSHKEKKKASSDTRLASRRWESTDKKKLPDATSIPVVAVMKSTIGTDYELVGLLDYYERSRSAPTKLYYLDKSGHISPNLKGDRKHYKASRSVDDRRHNKNCYIANGVEHLTSKTTASVTPRKACMLADSTRRAWDESDVSLNGKRRDETERKRSGTVESNSIESEPDLVHSDTETATSGPSNESRNMSKTTNIGQNSQNTFETQKKQKLAPRPTLFNYKKEKSDSRVIKHLRGVFCQDRRKVRHNVTYAAFIEEKEHNQQATEEHKMEVAGLFHNAIHFVRMVVRLLTSMMDLSGEMTSRSATEERWHTLNTSRQVREMAFNKTAFAKRKGFYKLPRWAKLILEKFPDERTDADLRRIHALLRGLKSFDKFTEKIQLSMCRSFTYHSVRSGRIILRQGHVGVNFYFLYTGSVFVNTDDTDVQGNKFSRTEVVLRRGDSFGELALLQDIRRTATISCREDCELLVVDKDTFAKVCPKIFEKEMDEKVNFLSRLPLFNARFWPSDAIEKMCFEAQIQEYKTNKVLVSNNATDDWIYLCMGGKCQIIRKLNLGEEIQWRKLQQSVLDRLESHRNRSEVDTFDFRTSITDKMSSSEEDARQSFVADLNEGKERMLESMGLEYRKARKKSYRQSTKQELEARNKSPVQEQGQMTLTSVIKQEGTGDNDNLYLNIKVLENGEVFDLTTVLDSQKGEIDMTGSYMLVSNGARVMRIKRTSFFKYASPEALQHARKITKQERFPPDDVLLRCYRDQLNWQVYKQMVLRETFVKINHKKDKFKDNAALMTTCEAEPETQIEIDDVNKRTIKELEHVLPVDDKPNTEVQYWQKLETLTHKTVKKPIKHRVTFKLEPAKDITARVNHEEEMPSYPDTGNSSKPNSIALNCYIGQRRNSVATGDLRRENLPHESLSAKRRCSQHPVDFTSIQEEDDGIGLDN